MVTQTIFHLEPTNSRSHFQSTTMVSETRSVLKLKMISIQSAAGLDIFSDTRFFHDTTE